MGCHGDLTFLFSGSGVVVLFAVAEHEEQRVPAQGEAFGQFHLLRHTYLTQENRRLGPAQSVSACVCACVCVGEIDSDE